MTPNRNTQSINIIAFRVNGLWGLVTAWTIVINMDSIFAHIRNTTVDTRYENRIHITLFDWTQRYLSESLYLLLLLGIWQIRWYKGLDFHGISFFRPFTRINFTHRTRPKGLEYKYTWFEFPLFVPVLFCRCILSFDIVKSVWMVLFIEFHNLNHHRCHVAAKRLLFVPLASALSAEGRDIQKIRW